MSKDFTREEGELVGAIRPAPDGGEPVFRVVRRDGFPGLGPQDENVRPCDHRRFTLDEKWSTVTCRDCKTQIDAFAALMQHALYWESIRREIERNEHAERGLHVARLHRIKDRRALTVEERNEVLATISRQYAMKAKDVGEVASRTEKVLRERKVQRRRRERA